MKYINEYNDFEKNLFSQVNSKPEVFIANLIKDLEVKRLYDHPDGDIVFVDKNGKYWMRDDKYTGYLWVSNDDIWSKIKIKFNYDDYKIRDLIKYTVEFVFKLNVGRPLLVRGTL